MLVWSSVSVVFVSFAFASYSLLVPEFLGEFSWTSSDAAIPFSLSMLTWGATQPLAGALADSRGTRLVILGGILVTALGFVLMGFAQNLWQITLAFGVLIGVGMSACGSISFSLFISKWFTGSNRGSAVGILQAATPASPMLLAPVFFFTMANLGWRPASLGYGLFLLIVSLPVAYLTIHDPKAGPAAGQTAETRGVWQEILAVLRNPPMRSLFISRFACGLSFLMVPYLAVAAIESGLTAAQGAFAVSVYGASSVLGSVAGGLASDRFGRVNTLVMTYVIRGAGALTLGLFAMDAFWFYLAVALASGPIFATAAINNVQIFEMTGARRAGLIMGVGFVLHQVSAALGPYASGLLFDWVHSYRISFLGLGVFLLLAAIPAARTGMRAEAPAQPVAG